jgi:hypothetical protein
MTWWAVRDALYQEYQDHDGYLPHHAEREYAPRMGIKPNSLRTRFTNDLKRVCEQHPAYGLTPADLALIESTHSLSEAYEMLKAARSSVPPFPVFLDAMHALRRPDVEGIERAFDRCVACKRDRNQWRAERGLLPV